MAMSGVIARIRKPLASARIDIGNAKPPRDLIAARRKTDRTWRASERVIVIMDIL
jgi:hypothetical protein